jgi:hypothetical protein
MPKNFPILNDHVIGASFLFLFRLSVLRLFAAAQSRVAKIIPPQSRAVSPNLKPVVTKIAITSAMNRVLIGSKL